MHVHDTAPECWRPVPYPPFDQAYDVSCLGRVRRPQALNRRGNQRVGVLHPGTGGDGYARVVLCFNKRSKTVTVHKMMAITFLGSQPFPDAIARHLDDVRAHNVVDNLAWGSHKDNTDDRIRNGRSTGSPGERNGYAKLTEAIVRDIRISHAAGESYSSIAKRLGRHKTAIAFVIQGRTWTHVV